MKSSDSLLADYFTLENIEVVYNKLKNKTSKGIDKIGFDAFEIKKEDHFKIINKKVNGGTYKFSPYLENLKLKGRNKLPRVISIPTLRDRIVLSILKDIIHTTFPDSINKRLPNKYIVDIKKFISANPDCYFFQTDIEQFYDKIDRVQLFKILELRFKNPILISLVKASINNSTIPYNTSLDCRKNYESILGVPQGLAISNASAHIYLRDFDLLMSKRKILYLRYVDDILILTPKPFSLAKVENVKKHLLAKNLKIHDDKKTFQGSLKNDITYLGYKINNKNISIADKNFQNFLSSITSLFTHYKRGYLEKSRRPSWLTDDDETYNSVFVENLNEKITGARDLNKNYGWLFFFSEITNKNLLFRLDKIIRGFFNNLDSFENKPPASLKRLVRAFYEIKHNPKSIYINDYNSHDSPSKKLNYLVFRGYIDPAVHYSISQIEFHYNRFKNKQLRKLEKDVGYNYF